MRVKHFLIPALLSLGACLAVGNLAHAQRGGHGGGGGGGHAGGAHMSGGHPGGMSGGHMGGHPGNYGGSRIIYGGGLGYGYGGLGYGYGGLGYGYGGLGYGYGGLGYGYGNVYSPYYSGAVAPQYSYYPSTAQAAAGPDAVALPTGAAQIRVILPDPNAKVFFDGAATQQTGTDRYFHTPDLAPGGNYSYRIRATWGTDAQEVVVTVAPGGAATADFRPRSEPVPAPKAK